MRQAEALECLHEDTGSALAAPRHTTRRFKHQPSLSSEDADTPTSVACSTTVSTAGDSPSSTRTSRAGAPAPEPIVGLTWKRGSKIGSGSYGSVYTALSESGRIFAVKQAILDDTESDRKLRMSLEEELSICKELRHPNIVSYLGHHCEASKLYIYLEYVAGGSMASIVKEFGALELRPLLRATAGLLEGLDYLHTRSPPVVHRDIKGANVLVDLKFRVKLADFGCSKKSTDTKSLTTVGSVPWMAPEVILQQNGHGRKADVWSLGCTVIEMATAEKPWGDGAFNNVVFALRHIGMTDATPPVPERLDAGLRHFISWLVQRNPDDRPSAGQALSHDCLADVSTK